MKSITDWRDKDQVRIGVAADHAGLQMKTKVVDYLKEEGYEINDLGGAANEPDPADDYPDYAAELAQAITKGTVDVGVLFCSSGIGMSMVANRFYGVRAALVADTDKATLSRTHNAANLLVLPGDTQEADNFKEIVKTWLTTPFSKEARHARRLRKMDALAGKGLGRLYEEDSEVAGAIEREMQRQDESLELIASENFTSPAICDAVGSLLTNKYAEGYPGKRYYHGCDYVDQVETLAKDRACELFGAEAANVQAHSGSQANMAAYMTLLDPGDTVLAMSLDHGGHLTHGLKANFSGRFYNFVNYGVDQDSERLDYAEIERLAKEHQPKMLVAGASAYPRAIDFKQLREIADSVNAYFVVDMAHIAGLVASGDHPDPVPYADIVTTTTHKTLRGPRGGLVLCREEHAKKINSRIFPGIQGGPLMHVIAGKAICFKEAMTQSFKEYQKQIVANAGKLADELTDRGFRIVSGGTDNHLMLVDLRPKNITGKDAANALDHAGITVNANLIPFDPEKALVTSGLRIGTPAVTTRGMKEEEMTRIADWIQRVIEHRDEPGVAESVRKEVRELTSQFPLPQFTV